MEDCRHAQAKSRNLKLVDFNPSATIEDGLVNEEATPLDDEAATLDDEGNEAAVHEDNDNDEGLNA